MKIVKADIKDLTTENAEKIGRFMDLGFANEKIARTFHVDNFLAFYRQILPTGIGVLFFLMDGDEILGLIGGAVHPDVITGHNMAAEITWRVSAAGAGWGMKLLEEFTTWAKERGATRMVVHLRADEGEFERLKDKLKRREFDISGYQFMKELK
jgi:GNAT superfamily N-acetyltransferase